MSTKVGILGAGAWGTALAIALARHGHQVSLWAREDGLADTMNRERENALFLPGHTLPPAVTAFADARAACDAPLLIAASSLAGIRSTLQLAHSYAPGTPLVWLCKGFEADTSLLPHQVAAQVLPQDARCGALSGPSFAQEVAFGLPVALTLAARDLAFASATAASLHGGAMRIYSSDDVVGVEVGGAVKNVMALAAGICDGLKLGHNARAALITRGLAEMARLGVALGGRAETLMGLTGMGDLLLTATGDLSRNRTVGLKLAAGGTLSEILAALGHVAEGVPTTRETRALAVKLGVEMPITDAVYRILFEGLSAHAAVTQLLARDARSEIA